MTEAAIRFLNSFGQTHPSGRGPPDTVDEHLLCCRRPPVPPKRQPDRPLRRPEINVEMGQQSDIFLVADLVARDQGQPIAVEQEAAHENQRTGLNDARRVIAVEQPIEVVARRRAAAGYDPRIVGQLPSCNPLVRP